MTDDTTTDDETTVGDAADAAPTRISPQAEMLDLLLSRAVQGDRAALDAVCAAGARDAGIVEELARWQADELRLVRAARALEDAATRVELPAANGRAGTLGVSDASMRWRSALGWGVAAVLALALVGRRDSARGGVPGTDRTQVAGLGAGAFANADDAFDAYLSKAREEGLVYGEPPPPTLVRSRELTDGEGFEVIVLRTVYERRRTPVLYQLAPVDEAGTIRPILIRPRTESVR